MRIGNIEVDSKLYLAPMAGVTDAAFRQVCREHGAEFGVDSEPDAGTTVTIRFPLGGRRIRVLPG